MDERSAAKRKMLGSAEDELYEYGVRTMNRVSMRVKGMSHE